MPLPDVDNIGYLHYYPSEWQKPTDIQVHDPKTFEKLNLPVGIDKKKQPGRNDVDTESGSVVRDEGRNKPQGYLSFDDTKFNRVGSFNDSDRVARLGVDTQHAIECVYYKLRDYIRNNIKGYIVDACTGVRLTIEQITNFDYGWWTGTITYTIRLTDSRQTTHTIDVTIPVSVVGERQTKYGNERIGNEILRFKDSLGRLYDLSQSGVEELFGEPSNKSSYIMHL